MNLGADSMQAHYNVFHFGKCDLYLCLLRELPFCKEVKKGGDVKGRIHILHYKMVLASGFTAR